jgi:hypothetical protein
MADKKISQLSAASTPLAGTEVLPIVQSSSTKKVSADDLTAGRAVSAASLTLTSTPLAVGSGGTGTATSLTAGSVVFAGASGVYSQNNANLFWDNTNARLGVGTATPATKLDVKGAQNGAQATFTFSAGRGLVISTSSDSATNDRTAVYNVPTVGGAHAFQNQGIERFRVDAGGNIYGTAGTTGMTDGFFYVPSAAGAPTGTPTAISGRVPMYYDATNNNFYVYNGGWKKVTLS